MPSLPRVCPAPTSQARCAYPLARSAWDLPGGKASYMVTNLDPFVGGQAEAAVRVSTCCVPGVLCWDQVGRALSQVRISSREDCFGMSSLCCAHSPRVTKAGHLLLPLNMLSPVCMVPKRGPGNRSNPPLSPQLALLHRWASLKVKPPPRGLVKESGCASSR